MCLGPGSVLSLQVFNLLFEELDFSCALQLDFKLVPQLDILHDLLLNLAVLEGPAVDEGRLQQLSAY
jgi:hypothetical protein